MGIDTGYNPLQLKKTDNIGLYDKSAISTYLKGKELGDMSRPYSGMVRNHDQFFKFHDAVMADTSGMTDGAKDLVIGREGLKIMAAFEKQAVELQGATDARIKGLTGSLYSNSVQIDQNQIMMVGLVGEQLKKEGLEYLDRSEYVHPVAAMLAKAGLIDHNDGEAVVSKLNNIHSPNTLSEITDAKNVAEAVKNTIEEERHLIDIHTPTARELNRLETTSAKSELNKLIGMK